MSPRDNHTATLKKVSLSRLVRGYLPKRQVLFPIPIYHVFPTYSHPTTLIEQCRHSSAEAVDLVAESTRCRGYCSLLSTLVAAVAIPRHCGCRSNPGLLHMWAGEQNSFADCRSRAAGCCMSQVHDLAVYVLVPTLYRDMADIPSCVVDVRRCSWQMLVFSLTMRPCLVYSRE